MAPWFYRALESVSMASALSTALTIYPCQIRVHQRWQSWTPTSYSSEGVDEPDTVFARVYWRRQHGLQSTPAATQSADQPVSLPAPVKRFKLLSKDICARSRRLKSTEVLSSIIAAHLKLSVTAVIRHIPTVFGIKFWKLSVSPSSLWYAPPIGKMIVRKILIIVA